MTNDDALNHVTGIFATMLAAAQDARLAPPEGCLHLVRLRWKEGKAVCVVCREILDNAGAWAVSITEVGHDPA